MSEPTQEAPIYPTHREMLPIVLVGNIRGRDLIAFVCGIPNVSCCSPVFNWRQEKEEEYEVIDRLPTYTGPQRDPEQSKTEPESPDHCQDSLAVRGWAWLLGSMHNGDGTAQNQYGLNLPITLLVILNPL